MLEAVVGFGVLFALVFFFERKQRDIDSFEIATAVIVPVIVAVLIRIAGGLLGFYPWSEYVALLALIIVTFFILWKMLSIAAVRSAAYAGTVFAAYVALGVGIAALQA